MSMFNKWSFAFCNLIHFFRSSEIDDFRSEQTPITPESNINPIQQSHQSIEGEDQSLSLTIKFLNETQKIISANPNDTISKIKR